MFNESTRTELIAIIAEGMLLALENDRAIQANGGKQDAVISSEAAEETLKGFQGEEPGENTDFEEEQMALADKEAQEEADKKARKSAAAKKAAATKKANKLAAAKLAEEEKEAAELAKLNEEEPEEDDDFDDFGEEAEVMTAPKMDIKTFMDTLRREAGKHPNGELEGRALASATLKTAYPEVPKFKELPEDQFEPMLQLFIKTIKAI